MRLIHTLNCQHIGKHDQIAANKIQEEVIEIGDLLHKEEISKEQAKKRLLDFIQQQRNELETGQEFLNSVGRN